MFEYINFHRLPVWSQVDVLARKGNMLSQRKLKDYTISLYHLDNYFVEVWSKGALRISTSFKENTKVLTILEPYLENLEVESFLDMED